LNNIQTKSELIKTTTERLDPNTVLASCTIWVTKYETYNVSILNLNHQKIKVRVLTGTYYTCSIVIMCLFRKCKKQIDHNLTSTKIGILSNDSGARHCTNWRVNTKQFTQFRFDWAQLHGNGREGNEMDFSEYFFFLYGDL